MINLKNIVLELKNLSKYYLKGKKRLIILDDITYKFYNKKFYVIKGVSGAGKSTLIQILGLLKRENDGEIIINDRSTKKMNEDKKADLRAKEIGFVFQDYYLNPTMNALENVMLPMYIIEKDKKIIKDKALKLLKSVGLEYREGHYSSELSGGEQQRVAIARSIANNPNIILADEPTGSLDPKNEKEILKILKQIADEGKCVIVVSHSENVLKYADVVLEIKNHKLIEVKK